MTKYNAQFGVDDPSPLGIGAVLFLFIILVVGATGAFSVLCCVECSRRFGRNISRLRSAAHGYFCMRENESTVVKSPAKDVESQ